MLLQSVKSVLCYAHYKNIQVSASVWSNTLFVSSSKLVSSNFSLFTLLKISKNLDFYDYYYKLQTMYEYYDDIKQNTHTFFLKSEQMILFPTNVKLCVTTSSQIGMCYAVLCAEKSNENVKKNSNALTQQ